MCVTIYESQSNEKLHEQLTKENDAYDTTNMGQSRAKIAQSSTRVSASDKIDAGLKLFMMKGDKIHTMSTTEAILSHDEASSTAICTNETIETVSLKILLQICIGKIFYFYQVSV